MELHITEARSPQFLYGEDIVVMEIKHPVYGWIPFGASPNDVEKHGRDLYQRALAGEFGDIAPAAPPAA